MRSFLISLTRNPVSLLGSAITTASAVLIVTLFAIELFGFLGNPYIGILAYLVLPGVFLLGLILIPVGVYFERRSVRRAVERGVAAPGFPIIDLNRVRTRRWVLAFVFLSAVNVVVLAVATYKGVEVMDSTEFCGLTCHSVMAPEHTAYERSAHSRVHCVDCHIGPGADWFVKAKLSGARQVIATAFKTYPRPIPTPVHDLRPARETCEQCHWPEKFVGDKLRIITHFSNDEENTETKTVLMLRVGGIDGTDAHGIHWHVDPDNQIRYRSNEDRSEMYEVELTEADGTVKLFEPSQATDLSEAREWRVMDCIDCHNRPTHIYRLPEQEVDLALRQKRISRSLPFVRREGVRLLRGVDQPTQEEGRVALAAGIAEYYRTEHPEVAAAQAEAIAETGRVLGELYSVNVFPSMNVDWETYPNHIGHESWDGCFRCHNDEHETDDGQTISQDCSTCHALLAMEEENPEILATLDE